MQFSKYHGLGNDYLVVDPATAPAPLNRGLLADWVIALCDRQRGIGADGIVYGPLTDDDFFACEIWNPDGSQAEVSGNGLRIFARYLLDAGYIGPSQDGNRISYTLQSGGRRVPVTAYPDQTISVQLGEASARLLQSIADLGLDAEDSGLGAPILVNVGNPHCVFFPAPHIPINAELAQHWGPHVEHAPLFPLRTNVQFGRVLSANQIQAEIWERGAGYTLASGSSSCAVAVAAVASGRAHSPLTVYMPGGWLSVTVENEQTPFNVTLIGPVTPVFSGVLDPAWLASLSQ